MEIKNGDRVILARLDNEDEEYYRDHLNEEGTVICDPEGRFPCVHVEFDNFEDEEYIYVMNLDRI